MGAAATPAAPEALVLPEIDWWAVNQSFAEEKGAIILSGSAWVRYKSIKLEADHIVFFRETRELYAEGHIRLREGESELSAEVAYLDMVNERGYLVDATLRVSAKGGATPGGGNILRARQDLAQAYAKGLTGQAGLVSIKDPYGVYLTTVDDPQSRMNFVFKAEKIVRDGHLFYYAENAFLTNDDMAEPLYGIKVKRLEFECMDAPDPSKPDKPDATYVKPKLIRGRGAQLKIGPLTLFPFPTITYDLTKPLGYMRYDWGQSSYYGYYLLFRVGWGLGGAETKQFNPARLYIDADLRQKRGPALGTEFRWKTGARPEDPEARAAFEQGAGHVRLYGLDEIFTTSSDDLSRAARNRDRRLLPKFDGDPRRKYDANLLFVARRKADGAGPASAQLDRYADDQRWLVDFAHHQPLRNVAGLSDVQLDFLYQRQSDRDFMLEYYDHNYLLMNQPEALASARKAGDNYSVELLYRTDPQEFDGVPPRSPVAQGAFTSYEPAFTYSLLPYALPKGFYVSGEAQVAKLGRSFERELVDQSDFDSGRVYGKVSLERPFTWCGWQFRPQVGGQAAAYDQSRDGGSLTQAAATWGVDVSKRFYGDFPDLTNEELGLHGFRHIVEPRLQYSGISTTTEDPLKVLDFDEVDDLRGLQRVRVGLDQFFQTGRHTADGTFAGSDIAGLNTYLDLYPGRADRNRLLEGAWSDLLNVNGYLNVTGNVSLYGALGYSLSDSRVETANLGLTIDPKGRWRLSVSERFNYRDKDRLIVGSDQTYVRFEFQLSERWGLIFDQVNQRTQSLLDIKGVQTQIVTLTRRYGPVIGQVSYHIDNTRKDHGYNFSLAPAFAYRNLVVPTQDLLVESTEVGEAEETPEERNFDPFQLIHLKGKKTAPQKPSATPPPAPGSTPAPSPSPRPAPTGTGPVPAPPAEVVPMDDGPRGPAAGPAAGPVPPTPKPGPAPARVDQDDWAAYPTAGTNP